MLSEDLKPNWGILSRFSKGMKVLCNNGSVDGKMSKELCHGRPETLGDKEEVAKWWRHNLLRAGWGKKCCDVR
jgi:hypothetical protein